MFLTLGNWIFVIVVGIIIAVCTFGFTFSQHEEVKKSIIPTLMTTFIFLSLSFIIINWYNTSTASGIRNYKDFQSELNNGIEREITINAEDGREIFHYEGKIDIESNHEDNYIKFESEEGKRYIIYYGIQDTIKIIEK